MTRRDGLQVSPSEVLRAIREEIVLKAADYQRRYRQLAAPRKAASLVPSTGSNQVWQLELPEFETIAGGN